MKSWTFVLVLAAILSLSLALFLAVISCVPEWSAYFGAGDTLVSNPTLLLVAGLVVTILFARTSDSPISALVTGRPGRRPAVLVWVGCRLENDLP